MSVVEPTVDHSLADIVLEQVREVGRERAKDLTLDTNLLDLGLDSLEYQDIIGRLEGISKVRIPEWEVMEIETCRQIVEAIARQQAKQRPADEPIAPEYYVFEQTHEYQALKGLFDAAAAAGETDPFFTPHEGISNNTTRINGRTLISYSGNNYLGMSGDPDVTAAAKEALDKYGTSVSASRLVSGTRPIHVELEREICDFISAPDAITFTSGHSTNTTVIGHLMGRGDLILHDELVHNSILTGSLLSGATRRRFPHNDWQALDDILKEVRRDYRKVLVIIEGVYSMDGDYPDVPRFIEVKNRHKCWLLMDEAHSIGTMGKSGRGMTEFFGIKSQDVDVWMGTLSKALGACGGYIAGQKPLVQLVKYTCPGVIFTIGLAPPSAAASLVAIRKLQASNERVTTLHKRAEYFMGLCRQHGFNTGPSKDTAIIPVILGNSLHSIRASRQMHARGISVQPILHPAVEESGARLRFFVNVLHTEEQLKTTADNLAEILRELDPKYLQHGK
jgi:8-amino-7-oxononanoate synthase